MMLGTEFIDDETASKFKKRHENNIPVTTTFCLEHIVYLSTPNKDHFYEYLKGLLSFDPLVREILADLCLNMSISSSLGAMCDQLKTMDFDDAFQIVKEAQKNNSFDLIKEFLDYLWTQSFIEPINILNIYKLASSMSIQNPHYKLAQDKCVECLIRTEHKMSLDEDDLLELKFKHALAGSNQDLIDMLYNQLCGNPIDTKSKVRNIKGDCETLLLLAKVIKQLHR